jgi:hypothetical protein
MRDDFGHTPSPVPPAPPAHVSKPPEAEPVVPLSPAISNMPRPPCE